MAEKENKEVKNSVFVDLFYADESAEENDIALFNAIHDEPLPEGTVIRRFQNVWKKGFLLIISNGREAR